MILDLTIIEKIILAVGAFVLTMLAVWLSKALLGCFLRILLFSSLISFLYWLFIVNP